MVAEPDSVKLIRILPTGTEFVVVLKLGDDTDVWARTFDRQMDAEAYADVCAAMLNGEDVEYAELDSKGAAEEPSEEADMSGGNDDDSWDDEPAPKAEPATQAADEDSWDDWDDEPAPKVEAKSAAADEDSWDDWDDEPAPKAETKSAAADEDSWDDWDDEPAPKAETKSAAADEDSWDDWDDEPEAKPAPKTSSSKSKKASATAEKKTGKAKNTVKADIQQSDQDDADKKESKSTKKASGTSSKSPAKKRRRSAKRREALSFTPVDDDSDAWSPEWGEDSAEDWHDD